MFHSQLLMAQSVSLYYGTVPHSLPRMLGMEVRKARRSLTWKMGDFYLGRAYPCLALRSIEKRISHINKKTSQSTRFFIILASRPQRKTARHSFIISNTTKGKTQVQSALQRLTAENPPEQTTNQRVPKQ